MNAPISSSAGPRYSIIVAAYNVAAQIGDCLDSLTVPSITDCEILVVNDGSTDATRDRIAAYASDSRVRVIDKPNGGLSDARNTGIDAARGEYLMFVDGDDWVEPTLTAVFDTALAARPQPDLLVFGINEIHGTSVHTSLWQADFWSMTNSACNKLFHRDLFVEARFDRGFVYEDLALIPALFLRARRSLTVAEALYNYRRDRPDSITQSVDVDVLYQLARSATRCLERIEQDRAAHRAPPPESRLGDDWQARFETEQIFIPGVLHRARQIADRRTRRRYIAGMLARLPDRRRIRLARVWHGYGPKMTAGAALYRLGWTEAGHFLLHDTGVLKQRAQALALRLRRR